MGRTFARAGKSKHALKLTVFTRDNFTCQDCGYRPDWEPYEGWKGETMVGDLKVNPEDPGIKGTVWINFLTLDHVVEHALGGPGKPENLQTLCYCCNAKKAKEFSRKVERLARQYRISRAEAKQRVLQNA